MEKAEWLEARRNGIGGSDAPVVCGLSKYMTPFELYLDKRGELPQKEETEPMFWGTALQPVITQRYADLTGKKVSTPEGIFRHPEHSFMLANVDGLLPDRVLEVKTSRTAEGWGEPGTDEIPEPYILQVAHYMSVLKRELADIAVLIGGSDFRIYTVEKDPELEAMLIEKEQAFWKMVEEGTPPEPITFNDMQMRFGSASEARVVQADATVMETVEKLRDLTVSVKTAEELIQAGKTLLMGTMAESDTLASGDEILATWKMDKPGKRFSQAMLKEKHPEIFKECQEDKKPTRRFLLK